MAGFHAQGRYQGCFAIAWQAMYSKANRVQLVLSDANCNLLFDYGVFQYWQFVLFQNSIRCLFGGFLQSFCYKATILSFPNFLISVHCVVPRLNRSLLPSRYGFRKSSNADTRARTSLAKLIYTLGYYSWCFGDFFPSLATWKLFSKSSTTRDISCSGSINLSKVCGFLFNQTAPPTVN